MCYKVDGHLSVVHSAHLCLSLVPEVLLSVSECTNLSVAAPVSWCTNMSVAAPVCAWLQALLFPGLKPVWSVVAQMFPDHKLRREQQVGAHQAGASAHHHHSHQYTYQTPSTATATSVTAQLHPQQYTVRRCCCTSMW